MAYASALLARPATHGTRDPRLRRQAMTGSAACATPYVLDPARLSDHIDALYRAAWALCGSRHDAEDLVQTTFAHVLKRPRIIRNNNERAYLLRALRNTYSSVYRTLARRPAIVPLLEEDA